MEQEEADWAQLAPDAMCLHLLRCCYALHALHAYLSLETSYCCTGIELHFLDKPPGRHLVLIQSRHNTCTIPMTWLL